MTIENDGQSASAVAGESHSTLRHAIAASRAGLVDRRVLCMDVVPTKVRVSPSEPEHDPPIKQVEAHASVQPNLQPFPADEPRQPVQTAFPRQPGPRPFLAG